MTERKAVVEAGIFSTIENLCGSAYSACTGKYDISAASVCISLQEGPLEMYHQARLYGHVIILHSEHDDDRPGWR